MRFFKAAAVLMGFLLFAASGFLLFEPGADPTGFFAYAPGFVAINPFNHVAEGEVLEAELITRGTKDLSLYVVSGEAEFLELRCGDKMKYPDLSDSEETFIFEEYSCEEKSTALFRISSVNSEIIASFGREKKAIINSAE